MADDQSCKLRKVIDATENGEERDMLERAEEAMSNGSQHDIHASGNGNGNGHKNGNGSGHESGNGNVHGNGNGHGIGNGRPTLHEARTEDTCRVDVQGVAQLDDSDKHQECPAG